MNPATLYSEVVRSRANGADVTCIGPNPFVLGPGAPACGLCFGFDNGTVIFSETQTGNTRPPKQISPAGEAINGVARAGTSLAFSLAFSTRSDVSFVQFEIGKNISNQLGYHPVSEGVFPGGAHGVVATKSGYFVAPLGVNGLLVVRPEYGPPPRFRATTGPAEGQLYFYRVAALHEAGKEALVFANRRNGLGICEFRGDEQKRKIELLTFDGLDVIDVCGVSPGSLSAVALSRNAEILWIRDTSKQDDVPVMKLGRITGQVYRVLATPQHLFVLTSKALYVGVNLVEKVLSGNASTTKGYLPVRPLEAVDMFLFANEYILLVMADNNVVALEISELVKQTSDQISAAQPAGTSIEMFGKAEFEGISPKWQRDEIQQEEIVGTINMAA